MQSSGGLTDAASFRGHNAILSGPAGGVVAYAHCAQQSGYSNAIGFDMGGTSTDVSSYENGYHRIYEAEVSGVRIRTPMLPIHTIAAGGGSICKYDHFRLRVGPESAGSNPGPLCYGDPSATALTLTGRKLSSGANRC